MYLIVAHEAPAFNWPRVSL